MLWLELETVRHRTEQDRRDFDPVSAILRQHERF